MQSRIKVAFVVTSIGTGGAEAMLLNLIRALDKRHLEPTIIVLSERTPLAAKLEQAGASVYALGNRHFFGKLIAIARVVRLARRLRPDVVQGWMVHGNMAAVILRAYLAVPVIWGIRHSHLPTG